jgi:hypothetical protein
MWRWTVSPEKAPDRANMWISSYTARRQSVSVNNEKLTPGLVSPS